MISVIPENAKMYAASVQTRHSNSYKYFEYYPKSNGIQINCDSIHNANPTFEVASIVHMHNEAYFGAQRIIWSQL